MTAREAALRSLVRIEKEGRYSNLETDLTLKKKNLSDADGRLYTRLVYGVVERKITLDYILSSLLTKSRENLDTEVHNILRLSAYQILFTDKIPESAAVNEGVELCKKYRKSASTLVNAVLRRLCREKEKISFPQKEKAPVEYLSVFYSLSPDICRLFYEQLGFEESCKLLDRVNDPPEVTLRVNTLKLTREEFCAHLEAKGLSVTGTVYSPHGVKVKSLHGVEKELESGLCFVQDEASQLCVLAVNAQKGMRVIDTCACPGGKSFGTAIQMENRGILRSYDLHGNKLSLVRGGAERLGISILETARADAREFLPELEEWADCVICDLPCSGLGVIAKKPDLRYKSAEEMEKLPEIQWAILENACRYVRKGGRLVFSTCTILDKENTVLFNRFLEYHSEFEAGHLDFPSGLAKGQPYLTLYPHIHGTDGFFISVLEKRK